MGKSSVGMQAGNESLKGTLFVLFKSAFRTPTFLKYMNYGKQAQ